MIYKHNQNIYQPMYEESLKSKSDNSSKCLNHFLIPIKGVDGRGHFKTLFISFSRRAKYKNIGKYLNLKRKNHEIILYK